MIYNIRPENTETYSYEFKRIEDNLDKVKVIDDTPDEGLPFRTHGNRSGRAIESDYLPKKIQLGGPKRDIPEIYSPTGSLLVNDKFKDIVEELEPNVHQFFPIELIWKDGSHASNKYWFNPCNRLDSVDREKTTCLFENIWKPYRGGDLVFNLDKIGNCHAWIDKFISAGPIFISEILANKLEAANLSGLGLYEYDST